MSIAAFLWGEFVMRILLAALPFELVCSIVLLTVLPQTLHAQWVKEPSAAHHKQTPGLVHETFSSQFMKTTVGYSVVLPPSYETSRRSYPVVYWLHGGGGNECSSLFTASAWFDLWEKSQIGEVILVYPNGFRSGYMDHHDRSVMVESIIIKELIPRIDSLYRTIADRSARAVHGFSMGASGSLKFAAKYPDLFCSAVAYGGGAVDLAHTRSRFILDILDRNLKSDPVLIQQNNTYHFLEKNGETLRRNDLRVMLICGEADSWKESAVTFRDALQQKKIPVDLRLVPDVGHNLKGLVRQEGAAAAIFQRNAFLLSSSVASASGGDSVSKVTESYYSAAEGRFQSFSVTLPPGFSAEKRYPLFVQVFGSAKLLPTSERPFIRINLSGRGVWAYRSMGRYDVMQAIARMKEVCNIDEDRIYMTGTSAGATGVMQTAAYRPDVFAGVVPLVAFGTDLPLENFRNLPIRCEHGVNDWTSAICNVRVQFQKIKSLGYEAVLNEHAAAGHGIRIPPPKTMDWLFRLKTDRNPNTIDYSCEHPRDGKAYWLKIERFLDPHGIARINVRPIDDGVAITTQNVQRLSLNLREVPLAPEQVVLLDGDSVNVALDTGHKKLTLVKRDTWQIEAAPSSSGERRSYGAGAAANLLQGEPLMVVYGTGGDESENKFLRQAADILSRTAGPTFKPANVRFSVRADKDVDDLSLRKHNLLIVGTPRNNSLLNSLVAELPYRIEDEVLHAGDREPLSLSGSVLGFHYFNPRQPKRLIYVVSPYLNAVEQQRFLKNPRLFLAGSNGFRMIDQPDLLVRRADLRIRREMQFNANWKFIEFDGDGDRIPGRFEDRVHLAKVYTEVMQRPLDVDFALWWGPEDKGIFGGYDFNWLTGFDPTSCSRADYSVRRRDVETMTGVVPGAELADIFDRWIAKGELIVSPEITRSEIRPEARYRLAIPMDLVPKLGQRRRVLSDVAPGAVVRQEDVVRLMFRYSDINHP